MPNGIAVIDKKSDKVIHFIEASGRSALRVLSGIRINMSPDFRAEERFIHDDVLIKIKEDPDYDD